MATAFAYSLIPESLVGIVGERDGDTRCYYAEGSESEAGAWFEALQQTLVGGLITPGAVSMFAPVTRAAIHKRLYQGRLTAFYFKVTHKAPTSWSKKRKVRDTAYCFIPVSECKAWGAELRRRGQDSTVRLPAPIKPPKLSKTESRVELKAPSTPIAVPPAPEILPSTEREETIIEDTPKTEQNEWHVW